MFDHFTNHLIKRNFSLPSQFFLRFWWISQKCFHFGGSEISGIDGNDNLTGFLVDAFFINSPTFPAKRYAELSGGRFNKFPHGVIFPGGDNIIFRRVLLEHQPLHFNIVPGMSPVPAGIQIADVKDILQSDFDASQAPGYFAGYKCLASPWRFMVK